MQTNYINEGFKVTNSLGEEEIIQIPYNLNNILVQEDDIIKLLNQFNVKIDKVHNIDIFRESFTHKSYCKKSIYPSEILEDAKKELGNPHELLELRENSYERLEYLGDRVLKLIVSFYLFNRYEKENEGFMTKLQTKIEDKKNLPIMSKEIGLGKFFLISKSIENMNGRNLDKIHEDIFEAFLGALFLSNGFEICLLLIINLLETLIDYSEKLYCDNNYKDNLLKYHHTNDWLHPKYSIIYMEGPPHKRKYIIGVEKHNIICNKDHILSNKDQVLCNKDHILSNKDQVLSNKDQVLSNKDQVLCNKDQVLCNKDQVLCNKENQYIGFGIGNSHKEGEQNAAKMALIIYGLLQEDQYLQTDIYYPPWNKINNGDNNILGTQTVVAQENCDNDETNSIYSDKSIF
jgi:dsRNA-specific ribonuclease